MGFTLQSLESEMNNIVEAQNAEAKMWEDIEKRFEKPIGTSVPALYSVFYKFIQNPSTVSVDTFKRMLDTDDTAGAGIDFLTTALASRLGKYQHKSSELTERVNAMLDRIEGGWFNKVKEMLSASWAGFFCGEKVWHNEGSEWVINRITPLPPTSILFEVDREGRIEPDGILQYQRNVNPFGMSSNFNFFGGTFAGGFSIGGAAATGLQVDPFAKLGDMPYPIRNSNSFLYLSVRIPRDKCVHYAFDSQGKMGNPYGRSILRRAFSAYISKAQTIQMMMRALDRKGTPLLLVYSAPNATVKDPTKAGAGNNKGRNVGMDAGKAVNQVFQNIHVDSVIGLPGKKGSIYEVDVVPMDAHADQFITVIQHFDRAILRSLLIPALVFSAGDGNGSFALGQEHARTWDKTCDGYLEGLKQTLREQVVRPYLEYNEPRGIWEKDGIGDFTKRELTSDERDKETNNLEKAVNLGVCDLSDLEDFNSAREKFGFEPKERVPESITVRGQVDEDGNPVEAGDDGKDDDEPKQTGLRLACNREQLGVGLKALRQKNKVCTMFLFEGIADPVVLHVTHKYFGKSQAKLVPKLQELLTSYFKANPFKRFQVLFDNVEIFGEDHDVKVLTPTKSAELKPFLPGLKAMLDEIVPDKWEEYLPHVSVNDNMDECHLPIVDYVLVHDGNIVFRASEAK